MTDEEKQKIESFVASEIAEAADFNTGIEKLAEPLIKSATWLNDKGASVFHRGYFLLCLQRIAELALSNAQVTITEKEFY